MAKISKKPIDKSSLETYLASESDFGFEIQILELLRGLEVHCTHGGTYEDPKTNKYREFDIRAHIKCERSNVRLAVECKNIKEYSPLLVSCLPRTHDQSYHEVICGFDSHKPESNPYASTANNFNGNSITVNVDASNSIYKENDPVGKSCVQVTRAAHDNSFNSSDSEIYDKWSQAVSSCYDLAKKSDKAGRGLNSGFEYSAIIPVLVVPDNCLWNVCYNNDGSVSGEVEQVDRVSYFIGAEMNGGSFPSFEIKLSHIELVTVKGITKLVEDFTKNRCSSLIYEYHLNSEIQRVVNT